MSYSYTAIFESIDSAEYALKALVKSGVTYEEYKLTPTNERSKMKRFHILPKVLISTDYFAFMPDTDKGKAHGTETLLSLTVSGGMEPRVEGILINNGGRQIKAIYS